jgi:uncharacterized protein YndB with AHSA1/START domain
MSGERQMADIVQDTTIAVAPERVYGAITRQQELARWWTRDVKAEPTVGSLAEFRFDKGETVFELEIVALDAAKKVEWRVHSGPPHWQGTTVTWALAPAAGGTALHFAHTGFAAANRLYEETRGGWEYFLGSLKAYLETGTGTPHGE